LKWHGIDQATDGERLYMNAPHTFKNAPGELRGATVASIVLGIWVFVSPFVLGVPRGSPVMWSNMAVGVTAILLALGGGWKQGAVQGLTVFVGAWLFASTFILNFAGLGFMWNNVLCAFALVGETAYSGALRSFPAPSADHRVA
jgi:hypothetical protein